MGVLLIQERGSRRLDRGHQRMKGNESAAKKTNEDKGRAHAGVRMTDLDAWRESAHAHVAVSSRRTSSVRCQSSQRRRKQVGVVSADVFAHMRAHLGHANHALQARMHLVQEICSSPAHMSRYASRHTSRRELGKPQQRPGPEMPTRCVVMAHLRCACGHDHLLVVRLRMGDNLAFGGKVAG
jgi:hypothetical protein